MTDENFDVKRYWYVAGPKTLVCTSDLASMKSTIRAADGPGDMQWVKSWRDHANETISMYASQNAIEFFDSEFFGNSASSGVASLFKPVLEETNFFVAGLDFAEKIGIAVNGNYDDQAVAKEVRDGMLGFNAMAKMALKNASNEAPPGLRQGFHILGQITKNVSVESNENQVSITSELDGDFDELIGMFLPMIQAQRNVAIQMTSSNNMRQIGLAILNYESAYQGFPPPVLVSESGHKYSWRIAILQFLDQDGIYDNYRFNEEWNSEFNSELTRNMPAVFRHPNAKLDSTSSSYFVVTGKKTVFPDLSANANGKPHSKGVGFRQISDGSSNTVMLVESNKASHWAEPVDIAFRETGLKKEFGGLSPNGMNVVFCDGSTRFLDKSISEKLLVQLLTRSGGEIVSEEQLNATK